MPTINNYRMFSYPKKIYSTTMSGLDAVWSTELDGGVSESEFYENGYRGGKYPAGPSCFAYLGHFLVNVITSVVTLALAFVIAAAAFIIGAVVDGIECLSKQFSSEVTSPAP